MIPKAFVECSVIAGGVNESETATRMSRGDGSRVHDTHTNCDQGCTRW